MLDFILVLAVGASVVSGFMAGFTRMAIGFAATILGILFGFWFFYLPAGPIRDYVRSETAANVIGFFAVFAAFVIAGSIAGRILSRALKLVGLSFFDRLGGAAFGFVRGSILAVAVVTVITAFCPAPPPSLVIESKVLPYATTAAGLMAWLTPRSVREAYHESVDKLQQIWSSHKPKTRPAEEKI